MEKNLLLSLIVAIAFVLIGVISVIGYSQYLEYERQTMIETSQDGISECFRQYNYIGNFKGTVELTECIKQVNNELREFNENHKSLVGAELHIQEIESDELEIQQINLQNAMKICGSNMETAELRDIRKYHTCVIETFIEFGTEQQIDDIMELYERYFVDHDMLEAYENYIGYTP